MVVAQRVREAVRPACPRHPGSRVRLDGYVNSAWSEAHRRPRYRCVTEPKSRGHVFSLPSGHRCPDVAEVRLPDLVHRSDRGAFQVGRAARPALPRRTGRDPGGWLLVRRTRARENLSETDWHHSEPDSIARIPTQIKQGVVGARGDKPPLGTLLSRPTCRLRSRLRGRSTGYAPQPPDARIGMGLRGLAQMLHFP